MISMFLKRSCIIIATIIFLSLSLLGCSQESAESDFVSWRRNFEGDVSLEEHSGEYISAFLEEYPNFEVTKIRWQMVPVREQKFETYIVEGISGNEKVVIKYLMPDKIVLGRVERNLEEDELLDGKPIEKSLKLNQLLTQTEISEIAQLELGGDLTEIRIVWKKESPTCYLESRKEDNTVKGMTIDAVTGEIINI